MGCNCRKSLGVRHIMTVKSKDSSKNSDSNANVNETTDKKEKLRVLHEMWEAAKKKKEESQNATTQNAETSENNDGK